MASLTNWRIRREGWVTYLPVRIVYIVAAMAGLLVAYTPVLMRIVLTAVAVVSQLFGRGSVLWGGPAILGNWHFLIAYTSDIWPFVVLCTVYGLVLGMLRRNRGFYYREIPWRPYEKRVRLPLPAHTLLLWLSGPVILYAMAAYVDRRVLVPLLAANFMLWISSGMLAWVLFELWTDGLLAAGAWMGLWSAPHRNLLAEYQVRQLLSADPELATARVHEIAVSHTGDARITGTLTPAQVHRMQELLHAQLLGLSSLKINVTQPDQVA